MLARCNEHNGDGSTATVHACDWRHYSGRVRQRRASVDNSCTAVRVVVACDNPFWRIGHSVALYQVVTSSRHVARTATLTGQFRHQPVANANKIST